MLPGDDMTLPTTLVCIGINPAICCWQLGIHAARREPLTDYGLWRAASSVAVRDNVMLSRASRLSGSRTMNGRINRRFNGGGIRCSGMPRRRSPELQRRYYSKTQAPFAMQVCDKCRP